MPKSCIGAQMYTLRDHLKTPADMAKTCARVRKLGYEAVQVSGFGPIETTELAKILANEGLTCAATHVPLEMMKDVSKCVEYHQILKCQYPALGMPRFNDPVTGQTYHDFAKEFSAIGKALAAKGLPIGYHNHSQELTHFDGTTGMDILINECDKAAVWFEIDTYWITHGGGEPPAWIDKVADRIPCIHFKDLAVNHKREQSMAEVGNGNLNWPRILEACKKAGVKWYLVERDSGAMDPFDSLKVSLDNMRAMGLH